MSNSTTPIVKDESKNSNDASQRGANNHKITASHLEEASKHHTDAAKHHESGDHAKAALSTIKAQGHIAIAHETQKENIKHSAIKG